MTFEEEDQLPDTSTGEGDNQSNPPMDDKADEASREPSDAGEREHSERPKRSAKRERLIKELSQPKAAEEDEDEPEETEVEAKTDDEAEEVEDVKAETKAGDEDKHSEHDTSDRRSKAKAAFEKLTSNNRELKSKLDEATPFAEYGKSMFNYCKESGLSTEKLGLWLSVAADAEKNPGAARQNLERMGIKLEPVRQVVKEIPTEIEDALLDMTTNGQVAPEAFKALVGMIRKARASTPPPVAEVAPTIPAAVPHQAQPTAAPQAINPQKAIYDRDLAKAVADIDEKEIACAAKYPADWAKMKTQITEAFKRYRGTDPKLWASFFDDELAKVVAKAKRPNPPAQSTSLRPSSTSSASKPAPSKLAALKADLVSGKIR